MRDTITRTLLIEGEFASDNFLNWICSRAGRLSLGGQGQAQGDGRIVMTISGDPILVDAMEVACSLGPATARVDTIKTRDEHDHGTNPRQAFQIVTHWSKPLM